MTTCQELEEIYPAFVLGAVDARDHARVVRHLAHCAACAPLVAGYQAVADALPFVAPVLEPPTDLKYRVLAALPAIKPSLRQVARVRQPAFNWQGLVANFFRAPAFAAALVLVIVFGGWNLALQNQLAQQAAFNQQMLSEISLQRGLVSAIAYADSQPRLMTATEAGGHAVGRLYTAPELEALALIAYDLPTLASQRVYQVWLIEPSGERMSGGTFTVDDEGSGWLFIHLPKPLNQFQAVGVTVEPAGGSPKPTGPKMLNGNL